MSTASQLWPPNNAFQPDRFAREVTVFEASIRRALAATECGGVMPQAPSDPVATATSVFDFSEFPVVTTPRLCLRKYSTDYLEDIFAVRNDPRDAKYAKQATIRRLLRTSTEEPKHLSHFHAVEECIIRASGNSCAAETTAGR